MADNVEITEGQGATIATDDVSGAHFQRVKLVDGTLDGSAAIAGDATYGLDVDVTRLPATPAGDNNIGNVDIASALPAGTNLIGRISASAETSTVYNATTALTPKFAAVRCNTSGNNTLVAAVADKKIRVLAGLLVAAGTATVRFESGANGTALTGQMALVANTGFQIPYCPVGNFETGVNTLLNLELSAAVYLDGWLVYVEV